MTDRGDTDSKATALDLVRKASELVGDDSSPDDPLEHSKALGSIVAAVEQDVAARVETEQLGEERLAKVEAQTRVLAEAVIAITETSVDLAPALRAVKAEM